MHERERQTYFSILRQWRPASPAAGCVLTLILASFVLFLRKPDALLNPQFWGEDGVIFFHQCYAFGLNSLFLPYAGYLHTIPRLIALVCSPFPLVALPLLYNSSAFIGLLLVCAYLFNPRLKLPVKPLFALSVVLIPYSSVCYLNITNLQWIMAPLLLLVQLQDPPRRSRQIVADYLLVIALGLTGPFVILCLPLFITGYLMRRDKHSLGICMVACLAAAVQSSVLAATMKPAGPFSADGATWIKLIAYRGFGDLAFGRQISVSLTPCLLAILGLLIPMGLIVLARGDRERLHRIVVFVGFGTVVFAAAMFKFRSTPEVLLRQGNADGYFFPVYLMLAWSLLLILDQQGIRRILAIILLTIFLAATARNFRAEPMIDYDWRSWCHQLTPDQRIEIPLNPPGWSIRLRGKD